MKILKYLPIGIIPLILMSYGWYLGQLHKSGYDIAGIFLFISGVAGLLLALIVLLLTRKRAWHEKWYWNALLGMGSCGIAFGLILLYARLHG
jgi:drug/metabolite transporter (DMT)-like permease